MQRHRGRQLPESVQTQLESYLIHNTFAIQLDYERMLHRANLSAEVALRLQAPLAIAGGPRLESFHEFVGGDVEVRAP